VKVDFVVVACSRDFELLKLQARSIAQYVDCNLVKQIIVIINDPDPLFATQVHSIVSEYGPLQDQVVVLDYTAVVTPMDLASNNEYYKHRDWVSAQVARLLVSRLVIADWYINLDCKNICIAPVNQHTFFRGNQAKEIGQLPKSTKIKTQEHDWWTNSCEYFGFDGGSINPQHCYSPFVFSTAQVQSLIDHIGHETDTPLAHRLANSHWDLQAVEMADISLYCAWLWYNNVYADYYCNTHISQTSLLKYNNNAEGASIGTIHLVRDRSTILHNIKKQASIKSWLVTHTQLFTESEWDNFMLFLNLEK
jgi:hypothetical protein